MVCSDDHIHPRTVAITHSWHLGDTFLSNHCIIAISAIRPSEASFVRYSQSFLRPSFDYRYLHSLPSPFSVALHLRLERSLSQPSFAAISRSHLSPPSCGPIFAAIFRRHLSPPSCGPIFAAIFPAIFAVALRGRSGHAQSSFTGFIHCHQSEQRSSFALSSTAITHTPDDGECTVTGGSERRTRTRT
jgi:hypothetical protein